MLELSNIDGEIMVFVDDTINDSDFTIGKIDLCTTIRKKEKTHNAFTVVFADNENMELNNITKISYYENNNILVFLNGDGYTSLIKYLKLDSLFKIGYENEAVVIERIEVPKFFYEKGLDNKYPKFDVHISDCAYSMKIYYQEDEYIEIPWYQSHDNIIQTLDYIHDVVDYFTNRNKTFILDLCTHSRMTTHVKQNNGEFYSGEFDYKLSEEGVVLIDEEQFKDTNGMYLVEWNKLFKLRMDGTWIIEFIL